MSIKYPHLLSPIQVGNVVFKNRLIAAPSFPNLTQGPEPYPSDSVITHYANKAKSGAALVVCTAADDVQRAMRSAFSAACILRY